jgi:hypothetical protein
MATKIQLKLFREDLTCIELATTMVNEIYPLILSLMTQLGVERLKLPVMAGIKASFIQVDGNIVWANNIDEESITDAFQRSLSQPLCPVFMSDTLYQSINPFNSPTDLYIKYCEEVISLIPSLKEKDDRNKKFMDEITKYNHPLKRQVFFEKYKPNKQDGNT